MKKEEYFALFDRGVDRRNTGCVKWDGLGHVFGKDDLIAMWVADMDFASPQPVRDALVARAQQGVYGYPDDDPENLQAICDWMKQRHALEISPERVISSPGVVDSLSFAISAFTEENDMVAIQPPVYGPFEKSVLNTGRRLYKNPLKETADGWRMDLENLEEGLKQGVKMLLLCSPHNPVGRIWKEEELRALCALCGRYGARIVSDEIHADFELPGHRHTPLLKIADNVICLISSTKTFNLAGLRNSSMLFGSAEDKEKMAAYLKKTGVGHENIFGVLAQTTAYREGAEWLDALLEYLDGTRAAVEAFAAEKLPRVKVTKLEGTYLMWLDLRDYGLSQQELEKLMVEKAGVGFSSGASFCEEGTGFMRMNIATPRARVMEVMERLAAALDTL